MGFKKNGGIHVSKNLYLLFQFKKKHEFYVFESGYMQFIRIVLLIYDYTTVMW